jgi:large subunit ribosomal protein L14
MVQLGSILKVSDKTSIVLVQCVKVLKSYKNKIAKTGDVILVSVQWVNTKKYVLLKARLKKKYLKGTIHRALVIRSKVNYCRIKGVYLKFNENCVILITSNIVPVSNRVYGPVLREMCLRWPSIGCVSICMI